MPPPPFTTAATSEERERKKNVKLDYYSWWGQSGEGRGEGERHFGFQATTTEHCRNIDLPLAYKGSVPAPSDSCRSRLY